MSNVDITIPVSEITIDGVAVPISGTTSIVNKLGKVLDKSIESLDTSDLEGATIISASMLAKCPNLVYVGIPSSVTEIENQAFYQSGLKTLTIPDTVLTLGTAIVAKNTQLEEVYIGNGISILPANTFFDDTALKKISIGDNIVNIGSQVFKNIDITQFCEYSGGSYYLRTRSGKLAYLIQGTEDVLPVLVADECTCIAPNAFEGLELNSQYSPGVVLPDGLVYIGGNAFKNCTFLQSIVIPDSVREIGSSVFYGCTRLYHLTLSNNLKIIPNSAFYNCSIMDDLIIPDSVEEISNNAFYGNDNMDIITLGSGIKTIGSSVFYGCTGLKTLNIKATFPPSLGNTNSIPSNVTTINIPTGTLDAYKNATNWSNFANKFVEKDM